MLVFAKLINNSHQSSFPFVSCLVRICFTLIVVIELCSTGITEASQVGDSIVVSSSKNYMSTRARDSQLGSKFAALERAAQSIQSDQQKRSIRKHTSKMVTLELYLDYICPFSRKMYNTINSHVLPKLPDNIRNSIKFELRQQIQPWHPSSTLVHEAALAVIKLSPEQAAFSSPFSAALFENQTDYFDTAVRDETRMATYGRLAVLAAKTVPQLKESDVIELLAVPPRDPNGPGTNDGNKVTNDLKKVIKSARLAGVHVSPTVMLNGVAQSHIESSFTAENWLKWLQQQAGSEEKPKSEI